VGPQRNPSEPRQGQGFRVKLQTKGLDQVREKKRIKEVGFCLSCNAMILDKATNERKTRENGF